MSPTVKSFRSFVARLGEICGGIPMVVLGVARPSPRHAPLCAACQDMLPSVERSSCGRFPFSLLAVGHFPFSLAGTK